MIDLSRGVVLPFRKIFSRLQLATDAGKGPLMIKNLSAITAYHAHIYFDEESAEKARVLREAIELEFKIEMGRFHEKPVGPHPRWSYQVAFNPEQFGSFIPWLVLNRGDLTIFVHAETGNELLDHTQHAIWLGPSEDLKLSMFEK